MQAEVTFSDGRKAVVEGGSKEEIQAAVIEYENSINASAPENLEGSFANPIAEGALLGFSDELSGALGATAGFFDPRLEGTTFGERYKGIRDAVREDQAGFSERNPKTSMALEVGGGLLTGGVGAKRAAASQLGKGVAKNVMKLGGVGAATGGVAGAGYSEADTVGGVAGDTLKGGAIGFGTGLVAPAVAKGVGKVVSAPLRYKKATASARPKGIIARQITRDDMTPQKVAADLKKLPEGAAIVDAGGESLQDLGRDLIAMPGKARNIAKALYTGRRALAPRRIDNAVKKALGTKEDFYAAKKSLESKMKKEAAPLYQEAYKSPVRVTEKLKAILERPSVKKALKGGEEMARDEGGVIGGHIQLLDYAKRHLDDSIGKALRAGKNQKARALIKTKNELLAEMDNQVDAYAKARQAYAGPKAADDALEMGRKFMREDAEMITEMLEGMTKSEKEFFRMGAIRQIRDAVMSKSDTADAYKAIFNTPLKREKVMALFPDKKSFVQFSRAMQGEAKLFETATKSMANSSTANKLQGIADIATSPDTLVDAASGGFTGAALNSIKTFWRQYAGRIRDEKVRNEVAELLFNSNKEQQGQILNTLLAKPKMQPFTQSDFTKLQAAISGSVIANQ